VGGARCRRRPYSLQSFIRTLIDPQRKVGSGHRGFWVDSRNTIGEGGTCRKRRGALIKRERQSCLQPARLKSHTLPASPGVNDRTSERTVLMKKGGRKIKFGCSTTISSGSLSPLSTGSLRLAQRENDLLKKEDPHCVEKGCSFSVNERTLYIKGPKRVACVRLSRRSVFEHEISSRGSCF